MSLQVWLPLNGDLHNQGLMQLPNLTENTFTLQTDGKIGKCYSGQGIYHLTNDTILNNEWSLCTWVKASSWGQYNDIILCKNSSTSTECQFYFSIVGGNTLNIGINGGSSTASYSYTFATNTWYHIVATYNGTTYTLYLNGEQKKTGTYSSTKKTGMNNLGIGCRSNNTNGTTGTGNNSGMKLNDVRIYDHCLSAKEVEEIAKGLVLHYPLNDRFCEATNNLFVGRTDFSNSSKWSKSQQYAEVPYIDTDGNMVLGSTDGSNGSNHQSYTVSQTGGLININANTTYTLSVMAKIEPNANFRMYFYEKTSDGSAVKTTSQLFTYTTGSWQIYSITLTTQATTAKMYTELNSYNSPIGSHVIMKSNTIQLEAKGYATPFTYGTRSPIIYDTSGYENNGTVIGTLTTSTLSPRYNCATNFNGIDNGILIENLQLSNIINNQITYSFWIKPEGENGGRSVYFGSYNSNSWSIEKTTGNVLRSYWNGSPDTTCTGATITDGNWQHICIVKNGSADLKVYINGISKFTSTVTLNTITFPTTYRIGRDTRSNDGTPYHGSMSDFRIYATALTEKQVADLYHTSMTIDNQGNTYVRELVE